MLKLIPTKSCFNALLIFGKVAFDIDNPDIYGSI